MKTEAEAGVLRLPAKGRQGSLAASGAWEKRQGVDTPSEPPEGTRPANTLIRDFWLPEL